MALSPIRQSWTFARAFFDELDSIIIVTVLITITTLLCTTLSYQTYCRRGPSNEPPDGPAHRNGHVVGLGARSANLHSGNSTSCQNLFSWDHRNLEYRDRLKSCYVVW